jgi:hypothetical protein
MGAMGKRTVHWEKIGPGDWARLTDEEVAALLRCSHSAVTAHRLKHGLPRPPRRYRFKKRKRAFKPVQVTLQPELDDRLAAAAQSNGESKSALARRLLAEGLETDG